MSLLVVGTIVDWFGQNLERFGGAVERRWVDMHSLWSVFGGTWDGAGYSWTEFGALLVDELICYLLLPTSLIHYLGSHLLSGWTLATCEALV